MSSANTSINSSPSGTSSRRSRAANKIITFAGLGGTKNTGTSSSFGGTSTTFPTFRFSPEKDELEEVLSSSVTYLPDDSGIELDQISKGGGNSNDVEPLGPLSESLPSSPKPGETSPIKEYIRKNWTNKWDKKSLSLDLDLRGKIKTVIEDKRKSIVSHFIPEEGAPLPQQHGPSVIPEHTGQETVVGGSQESRIFSYDNSTQKITSNLTQAVKPSAVDEYEEIGVDFLACLEQESTMEDLLASDQIDMAQLPWTSPPSTLKEKFEGVITTVDNQSASDAKSATEEQSLSFRNECLKFGTKLLEHGLTKICICLLAAAILFPLNSFLLAIFTFVAGGCFATVVSQTFYETMSPKPELPAPREESGSRSPTPPLTNNSVASGSLQVTTPTKILQLSPKSQGWMLEFEGNYNPHVITFHSTDSVFIRLDASLLYISTPSPKHRIPKRKLWNDPPFTNDIKFIRHRIYNLTGAQIFIAPERLASRRVWNKKYPIGIRLQTPSHYWQVTRVYDAASTVPSPSDATADNGSSAKEKETPSHVPLVKRMSSKSLLKGDKEFSHKVSDGKVFYLFARTCREKEDWFRRLINAAKVNSTTTGTAEEDLALQQDYMRYMTNILPNFESLLREGKQDDGGKSSVKLKNSTSVESEDSTATTADGGLTSASVRSSPTDELLDIESILTVPQSPMFLNAVLGRLLYDAVRSPYWSLQLQNMIQRKLNFVKRPPFVELLIVKDLDLGGSFPIIQRASSPVVDARGLWIDLDVTYEGNFCLTLETKINLMKLRRSPTGDEESASVQGNEENVAAFDEDGADGAEPLVGNLYDSEAEDSGESSEEEIDQEAFLKQTEGDLESEFGFSQGGSSERGNGSTSSGAGQMTHPSKRGKLLKMVEKVATSNFVSEMKVVKSAIGKVANTSLTLTVEVKQMSGTISVNIPSPPTNRVWMGFRTKPEMKLITTPKVGERQVKLNPLTDWIQRRIHQQIQRSVVLPNMDDVTIKLMEFKLPS